VPNRSVLIVLFEGVQSLDVTGPLEVFAGATRQVSDAQCDYGAGSNWYKSELPESAQRPPSLPATAYGSAADRVSLRCCLLLWPRHIPN
jgi:hypothetical protein